MVDEGGGVVGVGLFCAGDGGGVGGWWCGECGGCVLDCWRWECCAVVEVFRVLVEGEDAVV